MIRVALRNFGGTWESWEEELTVPRFRGMVDDLNDHPPLYILLEAGFHLKPVEGGSGEVFKGDAAVEGLMGLTQGGGLLTGGMLG